MSAPVWRQAGISYVRFLSYSSKVVRAAVKEPIRQEKQMAKRDTSTTTWRYWSEGKRLDAGTVPRFFYFTTGGLWSTKIHLCARKCSNTII